MDAPSHRGSERTMQTHDFLAECAECGEITFWRKANRQGDDGGDVRKGFTCSECGTFQEEVTDTRGKTHAR